MSSDDRHHVLVGDRVGVVLNWENPGPLRHLRYYVQFDAYSLPQWVYANKVRNYWDHKPTPLQVNKITRRLQLIYGGKYKSGTDET